MALEEYEKARKLGLKEYRGDSVKGRYPYVQVLDEILSFTDIVAEQDIGLLYIPIDLIIGTKTKGRTNAFSRNFYPLLDEKSEFAIKWEALYQSHLQEGIREPVIAYEFMHQFYIQEGNKRVSVLKYEGADSVLANVVRLIPQKDYTEENLKKIIAGEKELPEKKEKASDQKVVKSEKRKFDLVVDIKIFRISELFFEYL